MTAPRAPRITYQTLRILSALSGRRWVCGSQIISGTGLKSGTVYPTLARLQRAGWLSSKCEVGAPASLGRPLRIFYRLTALGSERARATLASLR